MNDLAETFNVVKDQGVALAKVDCSIERAICPGKHKDSSDFSIQMKANRHIQFKS